jgi:hypothetical protein
VVSTKTVDKWLVSMVIDEEGIMKAKGKNETEHNTIKVLLKMNRLEASQNITKINWRLNAPKEKWHAFSKELYNSQRKLTDIVGKLDTSMEIK